MSRCESTRGQASGILSAKSIRLLLVRYPHQAPPSILVLPLPTTSNNIAEQTLTVSQLTAQIKNALEGEFTSVWVAGEISNYSRPQSGHSYFTLKDDQAQIRSVMWRSAAARLKFDLADGLDVICHGHVDVYAPRGSYQLVIDQLQPKGIGALELALRKLREKLTAEGLFDPARKRTLPPFPRRVAFVTSPTGAAIHDFLQVLQRRWRGVDVLVIPARVQGDGAVQEIVSGIRLANRVVPRPDVIVVGRGGGSLEDLWSFNEEPVVRAIAASRIPTVSAVGHEIDVTLADLAADVRALTPSEAAERIVPAAEEISARIHNYQKRLGHAAQRRVAWLRRGSKGSPRSVRFAAHLISSTTAVGGLTNWQFMPNAHCEELCKTERINWHA